MNGPSADFAGHCIPAGLAPVHECGIESLDPFLPLPNAKFPRQVESGIAKRCRSGRIGRYPQLPAP
jgi:hypothetical protein